MLPATRPRVTPLIVALALVVAFLATAVPATAAERSAERIDGANRYETAAQIAFAAFDPAAVDTVYLATGEDFADALAAGACAAAHDAPVLLTHGASLPDATAAAFSDDVLAGAGGSADGFAPSRVVVAGGQAAVSDDVVASFDADAVEVDRQQGGNRYETSAELALDCLEPADVDTVYLATGEDFADSLAAVPAAARDGAPLLLTVPQGLHAAAIDALQQFDPDRVVLVGGPAALSEGVVDGLAGQGFTNVERFYGADRYATGAAIARAAFDQSERALIATGEGFADALGGGAAAAFLDVPLLLTRNDYVPAVVRQALGSLEVRHTSILGGQAAIGSDVEIDLDADLPDYAYASFGSGGQQLYAGSFDASTYQLSNTISGVYDLRPLFSPDGTQVAFTRAQNIGGIWAGEMAATGVGDDQVVEDLTDFGIDAGCEVRAWDWNAAGDEIAWTCDPDDGDQRAGITTLDGNVTEFEAAGDGAYSVPQFLPDGDVLVVRTEDGAPAELRRLDPATPSDPGDLVYEADDERPLSNARLSPDGSEVVVQRPTEGADLDHPRPIVTLLVIDVASGAVTEVLAGEEHGGDEPGPHSVLDWHPDGDRLLVGTGGYGEPMVVRFIDIATSSVDGVVVGEADVSSGNTIGSADVAPDGSFVLYAETNTDEDGSYTQGHLYRVNADGTGLEQIGDAGSRAATPALNGAALQ